MYVPAVPRLLPVLLAVAVAGCGGPASSPPMDVAASKLALVGLIQSFNAALAARDTAAIDSLYAPDASVLPAGSPRADGAAAIHRLWAGATGVPGFRLRLVPGPITIARAGDLATMTGQYEYEGPGPGNAPLRDRGKFLTVFASQGGRWRIVLDTWNSDARAGQGD